jgi:hypothetical protein
MSEDIICVVQTCEEKAVKKFFGKDICEYHYDLARH